MTHSSRRFTLVVRNAFEAAPRWQGRRMLFVGSLALIDGAVARHDVERIILDRSASANDFLQLLASIPALIADILLLGPHGGGFLSAAGRGGDRVLYALSADDVDFYLQTHELSAQAHHPLALTA